MNLKLKDILVAGAMLALQPEHNPDVYSEDLAEMRSQIAQDAAIIYEQNRLTFTSRQLFSQGITNYNLFHYISFLRDMDNSSIYFQYLSNLVLSYLKENIVTYKDFPVLVNMIDPLVYTDFPEFLKLFVTDYIRVITSEFENADEILKLEMSHYIYSFRTRNFNEYNALLSAVARYRQLNFDIADRNANNFFNYYYSFDATFELKDRKFETAVYLLRKLEFIEVYPNFDMYGGFVFKFSSDISDDYKKRILAFLEDLLSENEHSLVNVEGQFFGAYINPLTVDGQKMRDILVLISDIKLLFNVEVSISNNLTDVIREIRMGYFTHFDIHSLDDILRSLNGIKRELSIYPQDFIRNINFRIHIPGDLYNDSAGMAVLYRELHILDNDYFRTECESVFHHELFHVFEKTRTVNPVGWSEEEFPFSIPHTAPFSLDSSLVLSVQGPPIFTVNGVDGISSYNSTVEQRAYIYGWMMCPETNRLLMERAMIDPSGEFIRRISLIRLYLEQATSGAINSDFWRSRY
jgi:hypothetical protein